MDNAKQFSWKHYLYLLIWWLSMGYALDKNTVMLGLLLAPAFFLITTYKLFGKLIIFMAAVFVLTAICPPLAALIAGASLIFFLLKIRFIWNNWTALLVGIYAYGVYLMVVLFNNFFYNHAVIQTAGKIISFFQAGSEAAIILVGENGVETTQNMVLYGTNAAHIASYMFPLGLTIIFHLLLRWLYAHGYNTDRAFYIMGLTPLIMMAFILPFIKIDVDGHEIFHGSLADGIDGLGTSDTDDALNAADAENPSDAPDVADAADGFDGTLSLQSDVELSPKVISTLEDHSAAFSPAAEASAASSAARGIHSAENQSKQDASVNNGDMVLAVGTLRGKIPSKASCSNKTTP